MLDVRWRIYGAAAKWEMAVEVARVVMKMLPAMEVFPEDGMIDFHLAGFACQAGNLKTAKKCLEELFGREDADAWKLMALRFRLLEPLWNHIGEV